MSKKAYEKIADGLKEALAIAKGEVSPAKLYIPPEIDVKVIREHLGLSQDDFAAHFGFSINQIRDWEQARSRPLGGNRAYLMLIEQHPDTVKEMLREASRKAATRSAAA